MIVFNGARFVETFVSASEEKRVTADIVIFVASWENRALFIADRMEFQSKKAILISFENDGILDNDIESYIDTLSQKFQNVVHRRVPAVISRRAWGGELERLEEDLRIENASGSIAIDYTCLPKAISQTLFRAFIRKGSYARTTWMYSLGKYDESLNNLSFSQGVRDFFPIRHTPGDGGMSPRRVALVGLGSDESLIVEFLERYNFDRVFVLTAHSENSPGLRIGADRLRDRLTKEGRVFPEDFVECDASSVIEALDAMYSIISTLPSDTGVDIFAAGPKSHAVAACVVAEKFKSVRLMGREAKEYARYDVPPEGTISMVEVTDYKNPTARFVLE